MFNLKCQPVIYTMKKKARKEILTEGGPQVGSALFSALAYPQTKTKRVVEFPEEDLS